MAVWQKKKKAKMDEIRRWKCRPVWSCLDADNETEEKKRILA
jgi:hypothetical protein